VFFSDKVAGWLLPQPQVEESSSSSYADGDDNEIPNNSGSNDDDHNGDDDGIPYDGIEFFYYLLIVFAVSAMMQLCLLLCLFCLFYRFHFHSFRKRVKKDSFFYEAGERSVESNALLASPPPPMLSSPPCLVSLLLDDSGDDRSYSCGFEAATANDDYAAEGSLTIRRIEHPLSSSSSLHRRGGEEEDGGSVVLYYDVSGHGTDTANGPFCIVRGRMSPSGMFFWVQESSTATATETNTTTIMGWRGWCRRKRRKRKQRRLVTGLLDTDGTAVRRGHWQTDDDASAGEQGGSGCFSRFDIIRKTNEEE